MARTSRSRLQITRARSMRREPTDAEKRLWRLLRGSRLAGWRFRRQHLIGPYIVDFACFEARLVVEADGGQHSGSVRDGERDAYLKQCGWQVLRFWNNEVLGNSDGVVTAILEALGWRRHPHPNPPPHAGRGKNRSPPPAEPGEGEKIECPPLAEPGEGVENGKTERIEAGESR